MATVEEHYSRLLADVYSWMYGGWDAALARYADFFATRGIAPHGSKRAIDLGAGCGFQAIPLARLGFDVTAIDLDRKLLAELEAHIDGEKIETVCAVFACFLEFEPAAVKVHDLVYRRGEGRWAFAKSFYRKLRLPTAWVVTTLGAAGFGHVETGLDRGLVVLTAKK